MNRSKEVRGLNEHITSEESTIRAAFAGKSFRAADMCCNKMLKIVVSGHDNGRRRRNVQSKSYLANSNKVFVTFIAIFLQSRLKQVVTNE